MKNSASYGNKQIELGTFIVVTGQGRRTRFQTELSVTWELFSIDVFTPLNIKVVYLQTGIDKLTNYNVF